MNRLKYVLPFLFVGNCLVCFGQGLGQNKGDDLEISSVSGLATSNVIMQKQWLYRSEPGNDWYTTVLIDGIAVDLSFTKPSTTRAWWFRNPFSGAQAWGNAGETYMGIYGGNVAIGTTDPKGYKLAVAGNMIAESVKVKLQGTWPDYVFTKDYTLPSLVETEKYIKEKGHLPGIPSAEEVKINGVNLGEMNAKLLQKIEELTLYLIDMKKENEDLKKQFLEHKQSIEVKLKNR